MDEDKCRLVLSDEDSDTTQSPLVAVLVTEVCGGRVYGGYLDIDAAKANRFRNVALFNARECHYYDYIQFGGVFGLATTAGPLVAIGPVIEQLTVYDVSSVTVMTKEAEIAWQEAPVYEQ